MINARKKRLNKPYEWWSDCHTKVRLIYDTVKYKDYYKFLYGNFVENLIEKPIFTCESSEEKLKKFDWVPANFSVPIVSKRTLAILEEVCPQDFQSFPIIIQSSSKVCWENYDYFLINVIGIVEALDVNRCVVEYYENNPSKIYHVEKAIFKEDCMGDVHLAVDKNHTTTKVMSPFLRNRLKKEKVKGIYFFEDDENKS